jgi:hypothetical protein
MQRLLIEVEDLLTQKDLEYRLDVRPMTIHLWRKGYSARGVSVPPLPCQVTQKGEAGKRVRFSPSKVLEWLRLYKPERVERFLNAYEHEVRSPERDPRQPAQYPAA